MTFHNKLCDVQWQTTTFMTFLQISEDFSSERAFYATLFIHENFLIMTRRVLSEKIIILILSLSLTPDSMRRAR